VKEHGHRLVALHRDEGISGTVEIDGREGLTEALAAIRFNGAQGLVVTTLDRLARSLTVQEAILAQVWSAGGKVFATDDGEVLADDPDDPARTFIRQVMGAVGQLERGLIARRLRRGRQHKAETGGYAWGAPRSDSGPRVGNWSPTRMSRRPCSASSNCGRRGVTTPDRRCPHRRGTDPEAGRGLASPAGGEGVGPGRGRVAGQKCPQSPGSPSGRDGGPARRGGRAGMTLRRPGMGSGSSRIPASGLWP